MASEILAGITILLVLGIAAQWIAWRIGVPSILLLLLFGFLAGPISGQLDPDALFGQLLFPLVSLSVAVILFEGGLNLRFRDLPGVRNIVVRLITVGVLVTWILAAVASHYFLGLSIALSVLLGAILTVSGPTVVIPLLRHIRPRAPLGPILRWEGILIDPVGATLSVLVFEAIRAGDIENASWIMAIGIFQTLLIGSVMGAFGAILVAVAFRRRLVPDYLHNPFVLTIVLAVFTASNILFRESGLLCVTLMAVILANMRNISIRHVLEFKEDLAALVISAVFIILSARIRLDELETIGLSRGFLFLLVLLFAARPLGVFLSTTASHLSVRERLFLSALAPRGIVAAAVASIFAFELQEMHITEANLLVPYTFFTIAATVTYSSLTAPFIGRILGVAERSPQGVLFLGGSRASRMLARIIMEQGFGVLLVDTDSKNVAECRACGLPVAQGDVFEEAFFEQLDFGGLGRLLAMTANKEANALAAVRLSEVFGRSEVYQLSNPACEPTDDDPVYPMHLRGRPLFHAEVSCDVLEERLDAGAEVRALPFDGPAQFGRLRAQGLQRVIPLCVVLSEHRLRIVTADYLPAPKSPGLLIALVDPAFASAWSSKRAEHT